MAQAQLLIDSNGRDKAPPIVTPKVVDKLEKAFAMGCTDKEACLFAGIGITTLHLYQQHTPDFTDRKNILKQNPILTARKTVIREIGKDVKTAQWYLERKARSEFGNQVEINHNHFNDLAPEQIKTQLAALLGQLSARQIEHVQDDVPIDAEIVPQEDGVTDAD